LIASSSAGERKVAIGQKVGEHIARVRSSDGDDIETWVDLAAAPVRTGPPEHSHVPPPVAEAVGNWHSLPEKSVSDSNSSLSPNLFVEECRLGNADYHGVNP